MAVRDDVSIDWNASPRVINITSDSTELTIQDLVDTCREREERLINLDNPYLVDAAGKEYLGGTTYVGVTATLQNAVVAFKPRSGPEWVLCSILGGNLVAVDDSDPPGYIDVRKPTAYTSCNLTASSSATLQEQSSLQYSSFNGGVTIDVINGYSGTEFPIGTSEKPVNNIDDAKTIANSRGFELLYIIGDIVFDTGDSLEQFEVVGQNMNKTSIDIKSAADIKECEFSEASVIGILDGSCTFKDCMLSDLNYFSGVIIRCILLPGTITLGGGAIAHFLDCWSGAPGVNSPVIDLGGSGQPLALQNFNGEIKLVNKSGTDEVMISLNTGAIQLDSTITNGLLSIRGVGEIEDNSTGNAVVDALSLLSLYSIAGTTWKHVYVDVDSTISGIEFPIGTLKYPVNNMYDAIAIAERENMYSFFVNGLIDLHQGLSGYSFDSNYPLGNVVDFNGYTIADSIFNNVGVKGIVTGDIYCNGCEILDLSNVSGKMVDCIFVNDFSMATSGTLWIMNGQSDSFESIDVDMNGVSYIMAAKWDISCDIKNMTDPSASFVKVGIGHVTVDASNTAGFVSVGAEGKIIDSGSTGITFHDETTRTVVWEVDAAQAVRYDGVIIMDTINGEAGTGFPIGTKSNPSNNLTDALVIAETYNIITFLLRSPVAIGATNNVTKKIFDAQGIQGAGIVFEDGCSTDFSTYRYGNVSGVLQNGDRLLIESCTVGNLENFTGYIDIAVFDQGSEISIGQWANLISCTAGGEPNNEPEIDVGTSELLISKWTGNLKLKGKTGLNRTVVNMHSGNIIVDSTCVSGTIQLLGNGQLEKDESGPGCTVDIDALLSNENIADHVLDEDITEHLNTDSLGEAMSKLLGLSQENYYLDQTIYTTYNGAKLLTSGRIRIYSNSGSVGTDNDVLSTYSVTSAWSGDELQTYKVVKQ